MRQQQIVRETLANIKTTYLETQQTLLWVWWHILSPYGRTKTLQATASLVLATLIGMSVTYCAKEVIDALAYENRTRALWYTLLGVGGLLLATRFVLGVQEYTRELGWNSNYSSVVTNLSRLFFMRTAGEMLAENNEVGAEQIESAKDRVQNILYLLLFEGATVVLGLLGANILMFTVDSIAGISALLLIIVNIMWFLYCNSLIDSKMEDIDRGFRSANRRMIEKWNFSLSTKTNGVEEKVIGQITDEAAEPLLEDKRIWAYWFIPIDVTRGVVNVCVIVGLLCYGIMFAEWSSGSFAAIFFWLSMIMERFGYVGHLMRHLTSQTVRLRAVREMLSSEPSFLPNTGIIYQPKQGAHDGSDV